jgi:hypothetical protein
MAIPNTFADQSGQIQLSLLDENFEYVDESLITLQTNINTLDLNNITGNVDINGSLSLGGNWTVTETSNVLYFAYDGVNRMKLDASGNLTVTGDVSAFGTI